MMTEQKQIFWQKHIDDWRKCLRSQKEYCQQNNLSFASFGYW